MANPEHVEILKQGVKGWNQWRKDNPDIEPDLSELDFNNLEIKGGRQSDGMLNFSGIGFNKVDLNYAI